MRLVFSPLAAIFLIFGSVGVLAQSPFPPVKEGFLNECPAIRGITYTTAAMRGGRELPERMRAEICFSPENGWAVGPVTLQGFEKVQEYSPTAARYEVLSGGELGPFRPRLSLSVVEGQIPQPSSQHIYSISYRMTPPGQAQNMQAMEYSGEGWAYDQTLPRAIAVELNFEIQPRDQFATTALQPGDRLEIVTLVGGG